MGSRTLLGIVNGVPSLGKEIDPHV